MAKRKGSSVSSCSRARKKVDRDARQAENAQHLDKLPQELWEKILDELKEADLFPLALSCRYFRQKQKELVALARQHGPESGKPGLTLKTNLKRKVEEGQPASAEYLRFCHKEKAGKPRSYSQKNDKGEYHAVLIKRLAAFHGHLPLLQELRAGLKRVDSEITKQAVRGGQLETLQWLKTKRGFKLSLDEKTFRIACDGGHLAIIKWLRSEGCPWDKWAYFGAASGCHLELLKWLRSEGCPGDTEACAGAASGGHLELLKWLRSEGCPWDGWTWFSAAESTREWLKENGAYTARFD